jgi:HEAT repeat protein
MRYTESTISLEAALRDLQHRSVRVRVRAAAALGGVDEESAERARQALRPMLRDGEGDVRYVVAISLGELKDRDALDALVEQMQGDGHPVARQGAVIAMAMIGDARVEPVLLEALRGGPPEVRYQAAVTLAQLDPAGAIAPLRRALRDEDAEVRGNAAGALSDLGDAASCGAIAALLDDPAPSARFEAAVALARLGDRRGTSVLIANLANSDQRFIAAEHLFRCPDPEARPHLQRLLDRWLTPPVLRVWLAGALARLGEEEGRRRLRELLASRRLMTRGLCIDVLGQIGEPWAQQALRDLAASPASEDWREEIAAALGDGAPRGQVPEKRP